MLPLMAVTILLLTNHCRGCGCELTAYDESNFGGRSLLVKQQNANFVNDYFNDRIESLIIKGGCDWLLYEHRDFGGRSYLLDPGSYQTAAKWGGRNNHISSARALPLKGMHICGRALVTLLSG